MTLELKVPLSNTASTRHALSSRYTIYDNQTSFGYPVSAEAKAIGQGMNKNFDPLLETISQIKGLYTWPEGWNGYDVAAPNPVAIKQAIAWVPVLYKEVQSTGRDWIEPHVTATEDGDLMFEWWKGEKTLAIYISENRAFYIKEWGVDILHEMEDGLATSSEARRALWAWLIQ